MLLSLDHNTTVSTQTQHLVVKFSTYFLCKPCLGLWDFIIRKWSKIDSIYLKKKKSSIAKKNLYILIHLNSKWCMAHISSRALYWVDSVSFNLCPPAKTLQELLRRQTEAVRKQFLEHVSFSLMQGKISQSGGSTVNKHVHWIVERCSTLMVSVFTCCRVSNVWSHNGNDAGRCSFEPLLRQTLYNLVHHMLS